MAVSQNKKSPSRRDMRRSHDGLSNPCLAVSKTSGKVHRYHHIDADGIYRGRQVIRRKD